MSENAVRLRRISDEEWANTITHGIGVALSAVGFWALLAYSHALSDGNQVAAVSVFGASMVLLYLASTVYHAIWHPELKRVFQFVDHASAYLLIAGTYTPFLLICMPNGEGWKPLAAIWGLALLGVVFKSFNTDGNRIVSVSTYLALGWLSVWVMQPVLRVLPTAGGLWLVAGGLLYTIGVFFYLRERIPHNHAIWHLCVMAGTFCHFASLFWFVLPSNA